MEWVGPVLFCILKNPYSANAGAIHVSTRSTVRFAEYHIVPEVTDFTQFLQQLQHRLLSVASCL